MVAALLWTLALLLGAMEAWHTRHRIFSDGISYLEIAGKYASGDWHGALNAYWSPLYSLIYAAALVALRPGPYWQVATLHLINFLAYVGSLFSFSWLLRELCFRFGEKPGLPVYVGGYISFILAGVYYIGNGYCSPDMIAFCLILTLSALVLYLQRRPDHSVLYAAAGLLMSLTFLARTAFAPLALLYILVICIHLRTQRRSWIRPLAVTAGFFLLTAAPFVMALSSKQGKLTFGESGRLNYGWEVDGAARSIHWQGEPYDIGTPVHPTTLAARNPDTYVFTGPGTYSPWYDPSLWYQGIAPRLKLVPQARVLFNNLGYSFILLCLSPVFLPALLLASASGRFSQFRARLFSLWPVLVPCVAGIGLYCLVFVDRRYIAAFLLVIWMAVLASLPYARLRAWPVRLLEAACLVALIVLIAGKFREPARVAFEDLRHGRETEPNLNYLLAERFQQLGLRPGDKIAYIGLSINADWARLDGVQIVSEIPVRYIRPQTVWANGVRDDSGEIGKFWHADAATRARIFDVFRKAGARMVVTDGFLYPAEGKGWEPVLTSAQRKIRFGSGQFPDQVTSSFCRLSPESLH